MTATWDIWDRVCGRTLPCMPLHHRSRLLDHPRRLRRSICFTGETTTSFPPLNHDTWRIAFAVMSEFDCS
jgi:hypothetical protein